MSEGKKQNPGVKYRKKHPKVKAVWSKLKYKTKNFEIDKASYFDCINGCGRKATSYHHVDYNEEKLIYPMCQQCHSKLHYSLNKVKGIWLN